VTKRGYWDTNHESRERKAGCVPDPPSPVCSEKMRALREVLDTQARAVADALVQRSREIDAHLHILNNAQSRLDADRDDFLRQDLYKSEHRSLVEKVDKISNRMNDIQLWRAGVEGKSSRSNLVAVAALIISVIFGLLHFYQGAK
jgi:hypothetical protein